MVDTGLLGLAELIGEDVEHQLAVTVGVDVTVGFKVKVLPEVSGIDEVTVVRKADTVGAVHVERLGLGVGTGSCGRIAQVANSHGTGEVGNLSTFLEDLGSHAVGLELVDPAAGCACRNTGCILTTICDTRTFSLAVAGIYILAGTHVGEGKVPRGDPRRPQTRGSPGSAQ